MAIIGLQNGLENGQKSVKSQGILKSSGNPVFGVFHLGRKTCLRGFANNTGADQPAHTRSLISTFVIRFLESIIYKLPTDEISIF